MNLAPFIFTIMAMFVLWLSQRAEDKRQEDLENDR